MGSVGSVHGHGPPVLIGERCAAFPETFAPLVSVASGLHAAALAHQVKALTHLWLRSALSSQKLTACVQAVQASSRVRAVYAHNAPILGARALETARRVTAAVSRAAAERLAPWPQEVALLRELNMAMVEGDWVGDVADELVALQTCWHDDADDDTCLEGARPDAPVASWLRSIGNQASAVTQSLQHRWSSSKHGHRSGSHDGVGNGRSTSESCLADGAVGSGDGPWQDDGLTAASGCTSGHAPVAGSLVNVEAVETDGDRRRPRGLRRACEHGTYNDHDCSLLLEQVRPCTRIVAISSRAGSMSDGCNQHALYVPNFHRARP